jgi:hypothetical protein
MRGVLSLKILFLLLVSLTSFPGSLRADQAANTDQTQFRRVSTQYMATLGNPEASSGTGAQTWGIWRQDPGPRGVWLDNLGQLRAASESTPSSWELDINDWWLDENGLIMEQPEFPVPPGQYVVTGDRETVAILTIHPENENGERRWDLSDGASLYDVTHLPCRSARYTPAADGGKCTPANASKTDFPVSPGGPMPAVEGCAKQDYSVLFVIGVAVDN